MFKDVPKEPDLPRLERGILALWEETGAFEKLRRKNAGRPRWSFLDGPITANNPMGVHHAWGRTYKDLFQRFKAMQGFDQRFQNGFDCQGLWVEVEVEKELGFKSKRDIERFGLAEFVNRCKQRVLKYAAIQTEQSIRLGQWMDWNDPDFLRELHDRLGRDPSEVITVEGPQGPVTGRVEQIVGQLGLPQLGGSYFTFSDENNYQIWMFLKRCWERGWLYKGVDVMPWCPRCGTGISQHEISTEGYRELSHPAVYLRFPLRGREREALLVWTTTPWTLTSNVAAAVGEELIYVKARQGEWIYYLSKGTLERALRGEFEVLGEFRGRELLGWEYEGPFDELPAVKEAGAPRHHRVIPWEEVGEEEGTGIVHIAPGCGEEDFQLGKEHGLPVIAPLDEDGVYLDGFDWLTGRSAGEVAEEIFKSLEEKGLLYRVEDYTHRYPVCWRCGTELVFRLVDEWFISMGPLYDKPREELTPEEKAKSLRYQIMDVVDQIRWKPGFGRERELDWLRNMRDWMISKKRYWGLALPIWECKACGHFEVIGSKEELEERAVEGWEEFAGHTPHRPWIDAVKIACPRCGSKMDRIPDVGNPWLDAGIVPFSTLCYRTDRRYWEEWFPADFITESFPGQFRNWFYSLLAMSTVLEGKPPFKAVLGYATLLAEDGRPMHKSWGNAIEFEEAAERMGVDVMRWMFLSHDPERNLLFGYGPAAEIKQKLLTLWNVYSFYVTYANVDRVDPRVELVPLEERPPLDRWILAELQRLIGAVTAALEDYDPLTATREFEAFFEKLSNWYVRRSRRRFWKSGSGKDKLAAHQTLYQCLVTLTKLLAPFLPFLAEELYQNLVRSLDQEAPESVHHCDWPVAKPELIDEPLLGRVELVRLLASLGRAARSAAGIKIRQPLGKMAVKLAKPEEREALADLLDDLLQETNVKEVVFIEDEAEVVSYRVRLLGERLGPKFAERFPAIKAAVEQLDPKEAARQLLERGALQVRIADRSYTILTEEAEVERLPREGYALAAFGDYLVAIATEITPELKREGLARDLVRHIQEMRKEADLAVTDRILTYYVGDEAIAEVFQIHADYIKRETLSRGLIAGEPEEAQAEHVKALKLDGRAVRLGIRRVA
ncbi:MAG: isoleucine--tRNA ligase [Candidatus Bipolaricaulia bacterium]